MSAAAPAAAAFCAFTMKVQVPRMMRTILPFTSAALVSGRQPSFGLALVGGVTGLTAFTTVAVSGAIDATVTGLEPSRLCFRPARFAGALTFTVEYMRPAAFTAAVEMTDGARAGELVMYG